MKKLSNKVFFDTLANAMGKTYQFVEDIEKIFKKLGVYYDYNAVMYRADLEGLSIWLSITQPNEPRDFYYGILFVRAERAGA